MSYRCQQTPNKPVLFVEPLSAMSGATTRANVKTTRSMDAVLVSVLSERDYRERQVSV